MSKGDKFRQVTAWRLHALRLGLHLICQTADNCQNVFELVELAMNNKNDSLYSPTALCSVSNLVTKHRYKKVYKSRKTLIFSFTVERCSFHIKHWKYCGIFTEKNFQGNMDIFKSYRPLNLFLKFWSNSKKLTRWKSRKPRKIRVSITKIENV